MALLRKRLICCVQVLVSVDFLGQHPETKEIISYEYHLTRDKLNEVARPILLPTLHMLRKTHIEVRDR